jgi:putative SOS response-associated peptidase YedK
MCGRFVLASRPEALAEHFDAREAPGLLESYQPSFNVAPTMPVLGLAMTGGGERVLDSYRWGLIPAWARDLSIGNRLFNARAESLSTSRAFRDAFLNRRIAVLADGFYEWRPGPGKHRQPLFIHRADGQPLAFAGLRETWRDPSGAGAGDGDRDGDGGWQRTCTIITTAANEDLAGIHDRMPVILEPGALDLWLDPAGSSQNELSGLLRAGSAGRLIHYPVDRRVGDVRNNGPELIAPLPEAAEPEDLRLFT